MRGPAIPILLYHSVAVDPPPRLAPWTVKPDNFIQHLDAIVRAGCTPFTVSGLLDSLATGKTLPFRPLVVTFDDGFADFARVAAPALAERSILSTIYVTTGALAGRRRSDEVQLPPADMLGWSQLGDLEVLGVEVGAHSHTHPELDTLSVDRAIEEIGLPKRLLEDALGHVVHSFAYPHGYSGPRINRLVSEAGYQSACGVRNAFSSPSDNRFGLARLTVRSDTPTVTIQRWLAGAGAPVAPAVEWQRTEFWRLYRQLRTIRGRRRGPRSLTRP